MSWTDLHKLVRVIFGITQKPFYITLGSGKGIFWTCFVAWRETGH